MKENEKEEEKKNVKSCKCDVTMGGLGGGGRAHIISVKRQP